VKNVLIAALILTALVVPATVLAEHQNPPIPLSNIPAVVTDLGSALFMSTHTGPAGLWQLPDDGVGPAPSGASLRITFGPVTVTRLTRLGLAGGVWYVDPAGTHYITGKTVVLIMPDHTEAACPEYGAMGDFACPWYDLAPGQPLYVRADIGALSGAQTLNGQLWGGGPDPLQ
jgi:hypothetical protein